mgnify:CR=1 FL=1
MLKTYLPCVATHVLERKMSAGKIVLQTCRVEFSGGMLQDAAAHVDDEKSVENFTTFTNGNAGNERGAGKKQLRPMW